MLATGGGLGEAPLAASWTVITMAAAAEPLLVYLWNNLLVVRSGHLPCSLILVQTQGFLENYISVCSAGWE
jgi:hypothetical protein